MTKRNKRRRKQAKRQSQALVGAEPTTGTSSHATDGKAERPTEERMAHGVWSEPQGMGKHERPFVDLHADMIGHLFETGKITRPQEQAARHFQQVRARYLEELPDISGYKSCIAGGIAGYDNDDGNPDAIRSYRDMEAKLSNAQRSEALRVCDECRKPRSVETLRAALDAIG